MKITKRQINYIKKHLLSLDSWWIHGSETIAFIKYCVDGFEIEENIILELLDYKIDYKLRKNREEYSTLYFNFADDIVQMFLNIVPENGLTAKIMKKIFEKYVEILKYSHMKCNIEHVPDYLRNDYDCGIEHYIHELRNFKELIPDIENIIEENLEHFLVNTEYLPEKDSSFHFLSDSLMRSFPFSKEFIERNWKYFYFPAILKNSIIKSNLDIQKIVFTKILSNSLDQHLQEFTENKVKHDFSLSEEKLDEILLKYNL